LVPNGSVFGWSSYCCRLRHHPHRCCLRRWVQTVQHGGLQDCGVKAHSPNTNSHQAAGSSRNVRKSTLYDQISLRGGFEGVRHTPRTKQKRTGLASAMTLERQCLRPMRWRSAARIAILAPASVGTYPTVYACWLVVQWDVVSAWVAHEPAGTTERIGVEHTANVAVKQTAKRDSGKQTVETQRSKG
jgi:hypothetical protein